MARRSVEYFCGPKSLCRCGHTGDGPNSEHVNVAADGHGSCMREGCRCYWFTWSRYTDEYINKYMQEVITKD